MKKIINQHFNSNLYFACSIGFAQAQHRKTQFATELFVYSADRLRYPEVFMIQPPQKTMMERPIM